MNQNVHALEGGKSLDHHERQRLQIIRIQEREMKRQLRRGRRDPLARRFSRTSARSNIDPRAREPRSREIHERLISVAYEEVGKRCADVCARLCCHQRTAVNNLGRASNPGPTRTAEEIDVSSPSPAIFPARRTADRDVFLQTQVLFGHPGPDAGQWQLVSGVDDRTRLISGIEVPADWTAFAKVRCCHASLSLTTERSFGIERP